MKLTHKQRLFADEYIKSGNATQAYVRAGYRVNTESSAKAASSRLLTNVNLKHYIDAKMAEIESHKIADAKEAMQSITAIARGETTETQAQLNPLTGKWEKTEIPADLKTRLVAWREILKRYPLADELTKAQFRKATAEAELTELKVKQLKDAGGLEALRVIFQDDMKDDQVGGSDQDGSSAKP